MLAKGLGDANAAAQDAALEALQAYLTISNEAQAAGWAVAQHLCRFSPALALHLSQQVGQR